MSTISNAWGRMTALSSAEVNNVTATSAQLATPPAQLNPAIFQTWRREDQVAYVEAKGAGTPKAVQIGAVGSTYTAAISGEPVLEVGVTYVEAGGASTFRGVSDAGTVERAKAADFALAPTKLPPATFLSWTAAERLRYAVSQGFGTVTSNMTVIGDTSSKGRIFVQAVNDVVLSKGPIARTTVAADIPYYNLPGSSAGMSSAFVMDKAESLFPSLDGATTALPVAERPALFYTNAATLSATSTPTVTAFLEDFINWHSAYQLEYLKLNTAGTNGVLSVPAGTPVLSAFISRSDSSKFFIMNSLDKAAFARMTVEDQVFAATDSRLSASFDSVAIKVGLGKIDVANVPSVVKTGETTTAVEAVKELVKYIADKPTANLRDGNGLPTRMAAVDAKAWTDQLTILSEQLGKMGVVSPKDINKKLADLKERFDRAFAFFDVHGPIAGNTSNNNSGTGGGSDIGSTVVDVISLKGDISGIERGYKIFLSQERRIADEVVGRMKIVRDDGALFGKRLDVPELVYRFQSSYNTQLEAQTVAETEEINQQNDLLKTYSGMQDIINKTLEKFAKADEGGKGILGYGIDNFGDLNRDFPELAKLMAMFNDLPTGGQKHPIEALRDIMRPTTTLYTYNPGGTGQNNYDTPSKTHSQWSQFGTRLSETVTIINQNSQLKMNEVNTLDKQRNRHYELANSALSKMNDMLSNIARAG